MIKEGNTWNQNLRKGKNKRVILIIAIYVLQHVEKLYLEHRLKVYQWALEERNIELEFFNVIERYFTDEYSRSTVTILIIHLTSSNSIIHSGRFNNGGSVVKGLDKAPSLININYFLYIYVTKMVSSTFTSSHHPLPAATRLQRLETTEYLWKIKKSGNVPLSTKKCW